MSDPQSSQRMALANDLFPSLLSGGKQCTIRAGRREIVPGPMTFYATGGGAADVTVTVTGVVHKTLAELTDAEAQRDGAPTAKYMAAALKRFYPDVGPESVITIVDFAPLTPAPKKPQPSGWFSRRR